MHTDTSTVLDRDQLRDITLDDADLMREILTTLIDDTTRQIQLLQQAIADHDSQRCMRLAHYSKGACANVGASAAATVLKQMEQTAAREDFDACGGALASLVAEIDRLRAETQAI